jgi:hypothetical protein
LDVGLEKPATINGEIKQQNKTSKTPNHVTYVFPTYAVKIT